MTPTRDGCRRASLSRDGMRRRRPRGEIELQGAGGEPVLLEAECPGGNAGREAPSPGSHRARAPKGGKSVAGGAERLRGEHPVPPCAPAWSGIGRSLDPTDVGVATTEGLLMIGRTALEADWNPGIGIGAALNAGLASE
jgi:hypothetical protein